MNGNHLAARAARRGLAAAVILALAGCAAPARSAPVRAEQTSAVPRPSPTRSAVAGRDFADARAQWIRGASQISALQPKYWSAAAADLARAQHAGYAPAIAELRQLAALPDAQQTPAQNAAYHHDIDALNRFFGTPGRYS